MQRKIFFIFMLGIFIAVSNFVFAAERWQNLEQPKISYILISSEELAPVNNALRTSIKTLLPEAEETYLEYNSQQAKRYIQDLEIKFVPYVIYSASVSASDNFLHMARNNMVNKIKGYYVIPDEQLKMGEVMLLGRERKPNNLCIFAMGLCPYTKQAEGTLLNFIKQNELKLNIDLKYLVETNEFGISSSRGTDEIKEDIRQIVVQKYYPDKFGDYLLLLQNKTPEEALKELGIAAGVIEDKKEEALKKLKEDALESKKLGITYAPTFLWENIFLIPGLEGLTQHQPFTLRKAEVNTRKVLSGALPIEFFYSNSCHSCLQIKQDFLPQILLRYKERIAINYHDIAEAEELELKLAKEKEYGILTSSIPEVFLPNQAFTGEKAIRENLEPAIEELLGEKKSDLGKKATSEGGPLVDKFSTFTPLVVAFAGFADGINPCAFATMIFFVSFLALNSFRKSQISYIGGAFIFAVFLTYLALGLGIFQALRRLQVFSFWSRLIYLAIAFLTLGLGVYHLYDYIKYKISGGMKGCNLSWYNRLRSLADNRRNLMVLILLAFINGFIIALLELACTGQMYFPTIALMLKVPYMRLSALLYLLLYNLAFIIPLVVIFLLAYQGVSSEKFALFTQRHYGGMKITYTCLFFSLAVFLLLS